MQHKIPAPATLDVVTTACIILIGVGWFGLNSLVFSLGHLSQSTRFYELFSVIRQPSLLLSGVGSGHALETAAFTLVCAIALTASLAPWASPRRSAWLGGLLPLTLMLVCALALYNGGSSWPVDAPPDSLRGHLIHWGNQSMQWATSKATQRISLGAGTYLSVFASAVLAWRAAARYRAMAPSVARASSADASTSNPPDRPESEFRGSARSAQ